MGLNKAVGRGKAAAAGKGGGTGKDGKTGPMTFGDFMSMGALALGCETAGVRLATPHSAMRQMANLAGRRAIDPGTRWWTLRRGSHLRHDPSAGAKAEGKLMATVRRAKGRVDVDAGDGDWYDLRFSDAVARVEPGVEHTAIRPTIVPGAAAVAAAPGTWAPVAPGTFEFLVYDGSVEAIGGDGGIEFLRSAIATLGNLDNEAIKAATTINLEIGVGSMPTSAMLWDAADDDGDFLDDATPGIEEAYVVLDAIVDCVTPCVVAGDPDELPIAYMEFDLAQGSSATLDAGRRAGRRRRLLELTRELEARGADPAAVAILDAATRGPP